MEESTHKKIRFVVVGIAALLFVTAGVLAVRNRYRTAPVQAPVENESAPASPVEQEAAPEKTETPAPPIPAGSIPKDSADAQMKRTIADFVARFGTYSTDAENANLKQLLGRMGPTLKAWANNRIDQPTKNTAAYKGITTRTISTKIISQNATTAVLEIGTQRTYRDTSSSHTTYEIATATLVKSEQNWLVDMVTWKEYKPQ
jgi:hypothetical protein